MQNYTYTKKTQIRFKKRTSGISYIIVTAGILMFVALFVQLYVMSIFATKGDELAQYEARKEELVSQNKKLEQEIASIRNLDYIKQKSANAGYVDIDHKEVSYLVVK